MRNTELKDDSDTSGSWTAGTWISDQRGWRYRKYGAYVVSSWELLDWNGRKNWYYFDERGYMKTGWLLDKDGRWYYLNPVSDGSMGSMASGWRMIGETWYYFNEVSDGMKGAMLVNTITPDGFYVGADGSYQPEKVK